MKPQKWSLRRACSPFSSARLIMLFLALVLSCITGVCQDPPSVANGLDPSATYHGNDFDFVDTATGRLHLRIPLLADHSQRGELNFTYAVSYTSEGTWWAKHIGNTGQTYDWEPPNYEINTPNLVTEGVLLGSGANCIYDPDFQAYECEGYVNDSERAPHTLGTITTTPDVERSIDGSGVLYTSDSSGEQVTDNRGVQFNNPYYANRYLQDANGNQITFTTGYFAFAYMGQDSSMTDTLGRGWSYAATADYTGCPVAASSAYILSAPGPRTFKFCYSSLNVVTSFNHPYVQGEYSATVSLMTGIVLPNGKTWRFDYESYGNISAVYPPTGGAVFYSWRSTFPCLDIYGFDEELRTVATRQVFDGTNYQMWNYNSSSTGTTVTDPLGNDTAYATYSGSNTGCTDAISQTTYYSGSAAGHNVVKTVTNDYLNLDNPYPDDIGGAFIQTPLLTKTTTQWPNGQFTEVEQSYDSGFTFYDTNPDNGLAYQSKYGLIVSQSRHDYGSGAAGPIIQTTSTSYRALADPNYLGANLLSLVSSKGILDSAGNSCSEMDYGYDESAADSSGVSEQHVSVIGPRGNMTSLTRKLFTNPCTSSNPSATGQTTTYHFYDTGNLHTSTDPLNHQTSYTYDPSYYGAYLTQVCKPLNQCMSYAYDFNTGLATSVTDANNQQTSYVYNDPLLRPTEIDYPDTGQITISYNDFYPFTNTVTQKITPQVSKVTTNIFDGLGRLKQRQLTSDPEGTDYTDTIYDAVGNVYSVSNPYRSTNDSTYGITQYQYDPLNRITSVIEADLSAVSTSYSGNCTTVSDEALRSRRSCFDGLERLTEVDDYAAPTAAATPGSGTATVSGSEQVYNQNGYSGSQGPITASTLTDDGGGSWAWSIGGSSAWTPYTGSYVFSDYLDITNLGFSIPNNAVINGIYVDVNGNAISRDDDGSVCNSIIQLIKGGTAQGNNYANGICWPYDDDIPPYDSYYGSSGDLWGIALTPADINSGNFGLRIQVYGWTPGYNVKAYLNFATITVYYTVPSGTTYDSGTVWVTVNGAPQISAIYGQGDTASSVASRLGANINGNGSSPVTASVSGATLTLTAKTVGSGTNYSVSSGSSTDYPWLFSPSFTVSANSLSGGGDAGGSLTASTFYQYDALGNLLRVDQKNGDPNSANWRTRLFTYDSLSRLQQATNPESGTICYGTYSGSTCQANGYDSNDNLLYKTDARGVITSYAYDALNRVTQKSYNDGATVTVQYGYDGIAPTNCSPSLTMLHSIGRRTAMCDAAGMEGWSYDQIGRVVTDQRTSNGITKTTGYGYNFDGSIASLTYPSGRTVTYTPGGAARSLSAVDTNYGISYATSALYTPNGALRSAANGTAVVSNYFNARLQPCRFAVNTSGTAPTSCADSNTGNIMDLTYNFGLGADNGNVLGITNNIATGRNLTVSYDMLNRIESAYTSTWSEQYGIDLWGNLTSISAMPGKPAGENLSQGVTNQNRFVGMSYDAAGDLLNDGSNAYTFDAENRINRVGASLTYIYDGDGKRTMKANSTGVTKIYWYGVSTDPLDETDGTGSTTNSSFNEYVFFNGRRISRRDVSGNVFYYFSDHLGSTHEIVQAGQTSACYDADFYPFGKEIVYANTCSQNYRFAGKEHDDTGLSNFGARYDSSQYGRFMSPDPLRGKLIDPQMLNKYSYVRNNPATLIDPTGLYTIDCAHDVSNCAKQEKNFDDAVQKGLKSRDEKVRAAAAAYGPLSREQGDVGDNGVNVTIMKKVDDANDNGVTRNQSGTAGWSYDDVSNTFMPATQVNVKSGLSGNILEETVVHEGVHVEDRNNFINSFSVSLGTAHYNVRANNSLNILGRQSEINAFTVQNILRQSLGEQPIDIEKTLSRPPYSTNPSINQPIIPTVPQ